MGKSRVNFFKRSAKILKQRKKHESWKKEKNKRKNKPVESSPTRQTRRLSSLLAKPTSPEQIALPSNFSFIGNPEEVLSFFKKIQALLIKNIPVVMDFRQVETITPDVLALMMAKFSNPSFTGGTRAWLTKPKDQKVDTLLQDAGFYELLNISKSKSDFGLLKTKKNTVVDTEVAQNARRLTSKKTFGDDRKLAPLYRTLIECMANTRKHAGRKNTTIETWWLAVYNDPLTHITSFAFCDTGVGIFRSSKITLLTKLAKGIGIVNNSSILLRILEGKMESSTGLHYRGKGLPKIYSDYKSNNIRRLYIAANDVFADFDSGTFIELKDELNGTFLYWEIHP